MCQELEEVEKERWGGERESSGEVDRGHLTTLPWKASSTAACGSP